VGSSSASSSFKKFENAFVSRCFIAEDLVNSSVAACSRPWALVISNSAKPVVARRSSGLAPVGYASF
jgi:hypothetical protein